MTPGNSNYTLTLPDTKGQWQYVNYDMGTSFQVIGITASLYDCKGTAGTTVDIDHLNVKAGAQLTPPVFKAGNSDLNIFTYVGAPVSVDLSAADSSSTDVVAYDSPNYAARRCIQCEYRRIFLAAGASRNVFLYRSGF